MSYRAANYIAEIFEWTLREDIYISEQKDAETTRFCVEDNYYEVNTHAMFHEIKKIKRAIMRAGNAGVIKQEVYEHAIQRELIGWIKENGKFLF